MRRVSVVLPLTSAKEIKFNGTQNATKCHKTGGKKCERDKQNERKVDKREK
ncbi:hypothetical protein [uncultured Campylobacter sp.]|uniref:hypothetical protein n=1 Tax=uncultured Campylobacter sp. TaxID=218934 RepID=UPI00260A1528|nr:hypothetical protein [uncultured Campylobacter sp.]